MVPAQGYGFIDIGADEDVRFSRQVVSGDTFDSIAAGDAVEVDIVETPEGYEVTRVVPLQT
jgi:cold shock CspA family protein